MGVRAETVEGFFRIGTYWDNPVWGSPAYLQFMEDGVAATRPWAMEWDMEWRQVEAKREPVAPQEMETARDTLRRMEEDFTDG